MMSMAGDARTAPSSGSGSSDPAAAAGGDDHDGSSDDEAGLSPAALPPRRPRRMSSAADGVDADAGSSSSSSGLKIGRSSFLHRIDLSEFTSSSKLNALMDAIVKVKKKSPDHKSIVFSQ